MPLTRLKTLDRAKLRRRLLIAQLTAAPVGLVVLAVLLHRELPMQRIQEQGLGVATGLAIGLIGLEVFAVRLQVVARLFGLRVRRGAVWHIHVVTMFYYFFLPAGVGYDLVRVAKLGSAAEMHQPWHLAGLAAVERIAGGAGLVVLLLLALPFTSMTNHTRLAWLDPAPGVWLTALATIAVLAVGGYILFRARMPRLRLLYPAAGLSALAYALVGAGIWIAAESLSIEVSWAEILVAIAGTLLFQLIPVNFIGVSFGEFAAVAVYAGYGLERPDAVFLVTIAYLQRLAAAILGGVLESVDSARSLIASSP